mgnify:CR=1 FL=1
MKRPALSLVSANNVYLPYEEGIMPNLDTYTFDFDNLVDRVQEISKEELEIEKPQTYYDLHGRKVANPQQPDGIYIRNGKKILSNNR